MAMLLKLSDETRMIRALVALLFQLNFISFCTTKDSLCGTSCYEPPSIIFTVDEIKLLFVLNEICS